VQTSAVLWSNVSQLRLLIFHRPVIEQRLQLELVASSRRP
jgi:hypothetical protein